MRNPVKHFYEFGPFRLDADRRRLLRDGQHVPLPPKAMEALTVLIKHPGELMEREELMQAVWADSFVEDANLTVAISQLRKALGQNGETAEYIETIPRVGYRFTAEVGEVHQEAAPLVVEKHTLSRTVIEEEVVDLPVATESVLPGMNVADLMSLKQDQEIEAKLGPSESGANGQSIGGARGGARGGTSSGQAAVGTTDDPVARTAGIAEPHSTSSAEYIVTEIKRHKEVLQ